jgi:RNA polymerase sigma-70 factor (ECF subfamily)
LLALAKEGDARAWQRLVFLYTPLVRWWCQRHGVQQPQDVEDLTQEVFRTVAGKLDGFTPGPAGSFRRWLYTITRYKARDQHRRQRNQPEAVGGSDAYAHLANLADSTPPASAAAAEDATERTILVRRALELVRPEFQPRTWEAAWQVMVEGRCSADVAAELGLSDGAVRTAKSRVLARLRRTLAELVE